MSNTSSDGIYSLSGKRVWVAGHRGMVGSAIVRRLGTESIGALLTATHSEVDLLDPAAVIDFAKQSRPDAVFIAAARVGGIQANAARPVDFLHDNMLIAANVLKAAHESGVQKALFIGSSCIYPKFAPQPITEDALLTGPLEETNQWYAIAKIAGIKLCQAYRQQFGADFISAMPTNLFGPGDNYDLETSHVIPALIAKAHAAKMAGADGMEIWGTGTPRREFLHVDDCADALVFLMKHYSDAETVNIGAGQDIAIAELAQLVMDVVGLSGPLRHDTSKPDGTPRKLMSVEKLDTLGWNARIGLREGLESVYADYSSQLRGADR